MKRRTYHIATLVRTFVLFLTLIATSAVSALALDFDTARSKGLVGEVDNGYIAIPPGAGNEGAGLVSVVNKQRQAVYEQIAEKNGISVEATGQRTFQKRYPDFPAGTWVKMNGSWSRK